MNSGERRAARRKRREEERERKRAEKAAGYTLERVADMNALYRAQRQASKGIGWKSSTQRYRINWLLNTNRARHDLIEGRDVRRGTNDFTICERGKERRISSVRFSERVVQKSLSQNALVPALVPTLIENNTANIKGRGLSKALKHLRRDLARHYRLHGDAGYVLLTDFSDYFASIDHDAAKALVRRVISDPRLVALEDSFIDANGAGGRGLGLGSEPNQIVAVSLPNPIDHFATEMCGIEAYGRYMDDSYYIDMDKDKLRLVLACVRILCEDLGITLNERKTQIVRLSHGFAWLKKRVSYSEGGKVVMRPCRDSITRERRKLKKLAAIVGRGDMPYSDALTAHRSWRGSVSGLDAHRSLLAADALFKRLFASLKDRHR